MRRCAVGCDRRSYTHGIHESAVALLAAFCYSAQVHVRCAIRFCATRSKQCSLSPCTSSADWRPSPLSAVAGSRPAGWLLPCSEAPQGPPMPTYPDPPLPNSNKIRPGWVPLDEGTGEVRRLPDDSEPGSDGQQQQQQQHHQQLPQPQQQRLQPQQPGEGGAEAVTPPPEASPGWLFPAPDVRGTTVTQPFLGGPATPPTSTSLRRDRLEEVGIKATRLRKPFARSWPRRLLRVMRRLPKTQGSAWRWMKQLPVPQPTRTKSRSSASSPCELPTRMGLPHLSHAPDACCGAPAALG